MKQKIKKKQKNNEVTANYYPGFLFIDHVTSVFVQFYLGTTENFPQKKIPKQFLRFS